MEVVFFAGTNFRVRATGREKRENLNLAKITRYTVTVADLEILKGGFSRLVGTYTAL